MNVRKRKRAALIAAAVVVAMTAAACGGGDDEGGGGGGTQQGGRLVYGFETTYPQNWLPLTADGNSVATAYAEIRVLLAPFMTHPDFTVKPEKHLVVGEPTSEMVKGKQTVTYQINDAAVWSDGDPIDVKDFEFTWRLQKSSDPEAGGCPDLVSTTGYDQIESVKAGDDDRTVVVTYAKPFSDWKSLFQLYPQHIMDKSDPKANCAAVNKGWPAADGIPVSSGPFLLDKSGIDVGKKIATLTPNPRWWGPKPKLDKIILQGIGNDPGVTVKALANNEVQMVYPQAQLDLVKNIKNLQPTITSRTSFGLQFEHLDFNTTDFHLGQKPVRQAIAYALDRPALVAATVAQFDNRAQVLENRFFVTNQPEYEDTSGGRYAKQDLAKAQSLLEGAGYQKGSDGIYAKDGKRLSLEMMTTQANPLRDSTVDVIAQQLKPAGIEIRKFLNPDIFAGKEKPRSLEGGQFQIGLFAWVSSPYVSGNQSIYHSVKGEAIGQNYSRGGNPKVDALFPQINAATEQAKIKELGNQIDRLLWEDLYTIPLYQKPTFIAYSSNYTGIVENATNAGPMWNAEEWARKG
jgi:peptide/nickel transport system substrate-binding protein